MPPDLCDKEFAEEMTAERLVDPDENATSGRNGRRLISPKAGREWRRIAGRKNDWFDATVYAWAIGWHLETKLRLTPERWADLIADVHGEVKEPDLFDAAPSPLDRRVVRRGSGRAKDRAKANLARLNQKEPAE